LDALLNPVLRFKPMMVIDAEEALSHTSGNPASNTLTRFVF
jgi:hypothetical protein